MRKNKQKKKSNSLIRLYSMSKRDIVVIGTSAGGMNALVQLVGNLSTTLKASIFIVLHTTARSLTLLQEILQKHTTLPIITPKSGQLIHAGQIYVAPPHSHMIIKEKHIYLSQGPRVNHCRPAIDPLFRSAALHYGPRVVGIILTGMLDDGTVGLSFIKKRGGVTIVQDPDDAQHPDMPNSALANVSVDYCVALSDIPLLIKRLTKITIKSKIKPVPRWMSVESKLNSTNILPIEELNQTGKVSVFTCPECGGTLWEIDKDKVLRYRCRIGHAFSPHNLVEMHDETMESILWSAVRTLEENAELSQRIATHASKRYIHTANYFHQKSQIAKQNAKKLKEILLKNKATERENIENK
jgi:two-component system chemotaxis response regulator CheB